MTGTSRRSRGQNVSESESFSVVVPSLEGPEGSLGLRGPWGLLAWQGRDFSRAPGEGAPELQGEQKGIMVARMRARQSATSLLGAQARAGVRPAGKDSQRARETGKQKEVKGGMEQWNKGTMVEKRWTKAAFH